MEQIKNRHTGEIMCGGLSLKIVLEKHKKWLAGAPGGVEANLYNANLQYTDLRFANLYSADLRFANLQHANLQYTDLQHANLQYADLQHANLRFANLHSADFHSANLYNANLQYTKNGVLPVTFGPVGKELRTGYAIIEGSRVMVRLGCFYGTDVDAIKAVSDKYGAQSGYAMMVKAACKVAKERGILNPT